jgi:hypothetical protein
MSEPILFNFRIPSRLKTSFEKACSRKNVSMTSQLNILISEHIIADQEKLERTKEVSEEPLPFFMSYDIMGR